MSSPYTNPSTPLPDKTVSRQVIQQFSGISQSPSSMFTVELVDGGENMLLRAADDQGRVVLNTISYDTANALLLALSDALDDMEAFVDLKADAMGYVGDEAPEYKDDLPYYKDMVD